MPPGVPGVREPAALIPHGFGGEKLCPSNRRTPGEWAIRAVAGFGKAGGPGGSCLRLDVETLSQADVAGVSCSSEIFSLFKYASAVSATFFSNSV